MTPDLRVDERLAPDLADDRFPDAATEALPVHIPVEQLHEPTFSLRFGSPRAPYLAALMALDGKWPPIVVSRRDHTIIDGRHRFMAAKQLGHETIAATYFDGPAEDAYLEAIHLNVRQGLPLTLRERECAATRVLESHWDWSDRRIAELCALSPGTIKVLRGPGSRPSVHSVHLDTRDGRDGRKRPVDPGSTRLRIREALRTNPDASLRQIARLVNCSPETVRVVRGAQVTSEHVPPSNGNGSNVSPALRVADAPVVTRVEPRSDPALASTEDGAAFAAWFAQTSVAEEDCSGYVPVIPLSRIYEIADEAHRRARAWTAFARDLETRSTTSRPGSL